MDEQSAAWMRLQVARAAKTGAELIYHRIAPHNRGKATPEMERLIAQEKDAIESFNRSREADGETLERDDPPCCQWCGIEVGHEDELKDASRIERADGLEHEPDMICIGCFDRECEEQERRTGQCLDHAEETGR